MCLCHNGIKYLPIFIILSPVYSPVNLQDKVVRSVTISVVQVCRWFG